MPQQAGMPEVKQITRESGTEVTEVIEAIDMTERHKPGKFRLKAIR
jgi:hypothetical protein